MLECFCRDFFFFAWEMPFVVNLKILFFSGKSSNSSIADKASPGYPELVTTNAPEPSSDMYIHIIIAVLSVILFIFLVIVILIFIKIRKKRSEWLGPASQTLMSSA